jgi:hypothetical protein
LHFAGHLGIVEFPTDVGLLAAGESRKFHRASIRVAML